MLILAIIVLGFLAGGLAQLLFGVPMREVNWVMALGSGLIGSFIGGLLISLLSGDGLDLKPSGIIGSLLGAMLVTIAWTALSTRHKDQP
jgi:uncharacterized membrane protein YeaQ/YmgE (transglycosylase-associated protein family)